MRICFLTSIFPPDIGGPATYTEKMAQALSQNGFEITVVSFASIAGSGKEYPFKVFRVKKGNFLGYFFNTLRAIKNCGVIYCQNFSVGIFAVLAKWLLRKKLVFRAVGDLAYERAEEKQKIKDSLDIFQQKKYGWKIEIFKKYRAFLAKRADKILTPSIYFKAILASWGVELKKIAVIPNFCPEIPEAWVLPKFEAQKQTGLLGFIILSVGRLIPLKGFAQLISNMPKIIEKIPNAKLVVVGNGPEEQKLNLLIKSLGLEGQVFLVGQKTKKELSLYYQLADILLLNSRHDTFPNVVLEAMAFALPTVASRVGGLPEIIETGYNGFLFDWGRDEQMRDCIFQIYQNQDLAERLKAGAMEKSKDFDFNQILQKTLAVLQN